MSKYNIVIQYRGGQKLYVIQKLMFGMFWADYKGPNAMGSIVHEHDDKDSAIKAVIRLIRKEKIKKLPTLRARRYVCSTGREQFSIEKKGYWGWNEYIDDLACRRFTTLQEAEKRIEEILEIPEITVPDPEEPE